MNLTFTDHRRGNMRERRQVARGADRTLAGHDGYQVVLQECLQLFDHAPAHARSAAPQRQHLEDDDEAHHGSSEWLTDTAAMRQDQVAL